MEIVVATNPEYVELLLEWFGSGCGKWRLPVFANNGVSGQQSFAMKHLSQSVDLPLALADDVIRLQQRIATSGGWFAAFVPVL